MKYRMLAIDIDGTLYDRQGHIPRKNVEAVLRAHAAGLDIVLCTGRGLVESRPTIEALGHREPLVLASGAYVVDPETHRTFHRAVIEPQLAMEITRALDPDRNAVLILPDPTEEDHDYLVVGRAPLSKNTQWWFEQIGAKVRYVDGVNKRDMHHVLRVGLVGPENSMKPAAKMIRKRFADRVFLQHFGAVTQSESDDVHILEIFAKGVDKWSGLLNLMEIRGVAGNQVAAIGDHINDLTMIQNAGCGIAMGNAIEAVIAVSDRVTLNQDEAGVAWAIEHLLDGRW